jgi:hypothetical protein
MRAGAWKCRLLHAFIASYFSLFAISTLSYQCLCEGPNKDIDEHAGSDMGIPHLFLVELIGSKITHHSCPGSSQSAFPLIFLKKRAVLPTENPIRKTEAQDHALIPHSLAVTEVPACSPLYREFGTLPHVQLFSFHSGISPPYAWRMPEAGCQSWRRFKNIA